MQGRAAAVWSGPNTSVAKTNNSLNVSINAKLGMKETDH